MSALETTHLPPAQKKTSHFDPYMKTDPVTEIKSISIATLISSRFRCPDTKAELISIQTLKKNFSTPPQKPSKFRSTLKSKSTPTSHTEIMSIPTPIPKKSSQLRTPTLHPNQFNPQTEIKSSSTHTLKSSQFRPPTLEAKSISTPTLKRSYFRPAYKNQVNFDHRNKNEVNRSQHYKQVIFGSHTKTKSISIYTLKPSNFRPAHKNQVKF